MEVWETVYIWLPKALRLGFLRAAQEPKYQKKNYFRIFIRWKNIAKCLHTSNAPQIMYCKISMHYPHIPQCTPSRHSTIHQILFIYLFILKCVLQNMSTIQQIPLIWVDHAICIRECTPSGHSLHITGLLLDEDTGSDEWNALFVSS